MLAYAHALVELVHLGEASGRFVLFRKLFFFANTAQVVEAGHFLVTFCSARGQLLFREVNFWFLEDTI